MDPLTNSRCQSYSTTYMAAAEPTSNLKIPVIFQHLDACWWTCLQYQDTSHVQPLGWLQLNQIIILRYQLYSTTVMADGPACNIKIPVIFNSIQIQFNIFFIASYYINSHEIWIHDTYDQDFFSGALRQMADLITLCKALILCWISSVRAHSQSGNPSQPDFLKCILFIRKWHNAAQVWLT